MAEIIQSDAPRYLLNEQERAAIAHEMSHFEEPQAVVIEALKIVQRRAGWVPDAAIDAIAVELGIGAAAVEEVATFYNLIFRQPVGRHVIKVCDSIACYLTGYEGLRDALMQHLQIGLGGTSADGRFTLLPICCLGNCDKGPTLMIDDDTHGPVSSDRLAQLLEGYP